MAFSRSERYVQACATIADSFEMAKTPDKPAAKAKSAPPPDGAEAAAKPAAAKGKLAAGKGKAGGARGKAKRPPPRKTFLIAATWPDGDGRTNLHVYAAVTRSPAEAIAAVRAAIGPDAALELTGKLSNGMARTLGLKPDEIRQI